jgi:predicted transcriptional regulator
MTLKEIMDILEAEVITGRDYLDRKVSAGCASDLMSDVLAFGQTNSILLTGLATAQVVYTVEMAGNQAICLVRGRRFPCEAVRHAEEKGFVLLCT